MPEPDFRITGVEPVTRGMMPLLHFKVQIMSPSPFVIHARPLWAYVHSFEGYFVPIDVARIFGRCP